jgi:hypothetical protein
MASNRDNALCERNCRIFIKQLLKSIPGGFHFEIIAFQVGGVGCSVKEGVSCLMTTMAELHFEKDVMSIAGVRHIHNRLYTKT